MIGPNKSFTILLKNVISLPYSLQRKNAYVLANFTILSASKNPCARPLSYGFPFTDIYIKPRSSILFPFSVSMEEREENDGVEVDGANDDCTIGDIVDMGDVFGSNIDSGADTGIDGSVGDIDCGSGSGSVGSAGAGVDFGLFI